ncbi:hypothetical protein KP509_20G014700 [Ceratopteris richardii]|nr:hypothetical protein KP509_20G014700 [Ceratopteris richardii]
METSKMCLKSILPPNEDGDVLSSSQANDGGSSPDCYSGRNVSPQGSSTGKSLCIENSCSADSCVESDVGRSSAKAYDRKALCVKPSSMKRLSSGVASLTSAMSKCGKRGSLATVISISRTEKETIVHTDLLNFRRIVHQLTGASRNEEALMPVTISSRARGSIDESINCLYNDKDFNKDKDLTQPKPLCAKLYERRSPKTLENIMASCRELPPLVPSPVTPMSSGFERTLPATRAASPGDVQQEHNNIQAEWKTTEIDRIGNVHLSCKQNQLGTQAHFNLTQGQPIDANQWLSTLGGTYQVESVEDMVIAEKGFFLHPQRPRDNEPALLSLFPESPRG